MPRRTGGVYAIATATIALFVAALIATASGASVSLLSSTATPCPNPLDRQFLVRVATKEPLGLRLSDKLEILEFISDAQGRKRSVEGSGLAQLRDRLIAVNNVSLLGLPFKSALAELAKATLPKELRFETHDGRCITAPGTAGSGGTGGTGQTANGSASSSEYDYLILNLGKKDSDESFYAVLSAAGQPPSCLFREVVVASPADACSPLVVNATDRYVVVTSTSGCPMHQKAALAQEAGAKGVVFVQRMGQKPQQIKLPSELPKPIVLPLVMVSYDSGWQIDDALANRVLPMHTPLLRFVFSEACTSNKFSLHPDHDPLQLSIANRAESASAGFLSLTVAESAAKTISGTSFEFLKPMALDGTTPPLPLGKSPLLLLAGTAMDACSGQASSQWLLFADAMEGAFVVIEVNENECSVATQVEFFVKKKAIGIVFADSSFPRTARLDTTRIAAQHASIPFVFVSTTTLQNIVAYSQADAATHVLVEFAGENTLYHQWEDLGLVADVAKWPTTERARERLFYRMLKDQQSLSAEESEHHLVANERRDVLEVSFARAQQYYEERKQESVQV